MRPVIIGFIIGILIGALIPAVEGYFMAKFHRNRKPWIWFVNCYFLGLFALLPLICSPTLECDEELDFQENDFLGKIFLVIGFIVACLIPWMCYEYIEYSLNRIY